METIHCSKMMEFENTTRKYYNCSDIRISDVYLHNRDDVHRYHKHLKVTEILYILEGSILVKIKENEKITEYKINKNNIAIISARENHTVSSIDEKSRVLVIKYLKRNENLLETFLNDFQGE